MHDASIARQVNKSRAGARCNFIFKEFKEK
jgi:hypothetical protein